jgi:hypothetical protein
VTVHRRRAPLIALGALSLLAALWAGLLRLGWGLPTPREDFGTTHGPAIVLGFLGTLIALERAVAVGNRWIYSAPLLSGLGALSLIAGAPLPLCQGLFAAAASVLLFVQILLLMRQPQAGPAALAIGAGLLLAGNVLWIVDAPLYRVVYYWMGFLVVTIAGERLELSRSLGRSRWATTLFLMAIALLAAGIALEVRMAGIAMALTAVWLLRFDLARRSVTATGLTRYVAVCLMVGALWLFIGGALAAALGEIVDLLRYDAILHSVFLGFVMTMIFAHAPIVLPAVVGETIEYRPRLYLPLILLHATLILRVAGDLTAWLPGREWGGLGNVAAILAFMVNSATLARRGP